MRRSPVVLLATWVLGAHVPSICESFQETSIEDWLVSGFSVAAEEDRAVHTAHEINDRKCVDEAVSHNPTKVTKVPEVVSPSRPALRTELLDMVQRDQSARQALLSDTDVANISDTDPRLQYINDLDEANLRQLKHVIIQDGFPTASMVGVEGVHAAFVLTQHADSEPQFQAHMLKFILKRARAGELSKSDYALLTDRVLIARGKPQRYGTQFEFVDGDMKLLPTMDLVHLDERRRSVGLGSMADYMCVLRGMYGVAK